MIVIANTSVAEDGPAPPDFTLPIKPSVRPNPMVPPACLSLQDTNPVVGGSHNFTSQREYNQEETTPVDGDNGVTATAETEPALPGGEDTSAFPSSSPSGVGMTTTTTTTTTVASTSTSSDMTSTAFSEEAAQASGGYDYYNYITQAQAGEINWDYNENVPGMGRQYMQPVSYAAAATASSASVVSTSMCE